MIDPSASLGSSHWDGIAHFVEIINKISNSSKWVFECKDKQDQTAFQFQLHTARITDI